MTEVFRKVGLSEWDDVDDEGSADAESGEPPRLYYPNVEAFVRQHLAEMYRRGVDTASRVWCPEWWRHAEGIARLEALWRAWEHLRLDGATGMSVWFRDHADPHMAVLMSPEGPFRGCSASKGHAARPLGPLPTKAPPPELFQLAQDLR